MAHDEERRAFERLGTGLPRKPGRQIWRTGSSRGLSFQGRVGNVARACRGGRAAIGPAQPSAIILYPLLGMCGPSGVVAENLYGYCLPDRYRVRHMNAESRRKAFSVLGRTILELL